jgi:ubiquitin-activating enzyme E1 C
MDTIDLCNLNRQFLFRDSDVGKPKAQVAAEFINRQCEHLGVHVDYKVCKIQDLDESFYTQFLIVIAGLDNIPARRWLNSTIHDLVKADPTTGTIDSSTIKFLLDGGTEGLKGQARVIIPTMTACFECTLDTFPPMTTYPLCTIAETPRLPEHCIEYAYTVMWERERSSTQFNADNDEHVAWVYERALSRSKSFGIEGVTKFLTKGVVKRIIPAVASTNALIAAVLVNEAFKIATYSNPVMNNYLMFMGQTGVNCQTFSYERKEDCLVCGGAMSGGRVVTVRLTSDSITVSEIIERLVSHPTLRLSKPSITYRPNGEIVFMQSPPTLRALHEHKLEMSFREIFGQPEHDIECIVTDPALSSHVIVKFTL